MRYPDLIAFRLIAGHAFDEDRRQEVRNEAERIREFALTVTDAEVLEEVLAMAEELESRAREIEEGRR